MDTRTAIKEQFIKEYAKKDFALITVKALCAATPVARTTFYSYYDNTADVKEEIEDGLIGGLQAVADKTADGNYPNMEFPDFLNGIEDYMKEHWSFFYAFLISQPNHSFTEKWKNAIKGNFGKHYPDKIGIKNYDLIAEMIASAVIGAYAYWMKNPETVQTKEIKALITKTLDAVMPIM